MYTRIIFRQPYQFMMFSILMNVTMLLRITGNVVVINALAIK